MTLKPVMQPKRPGRTIAYIGLAAIILAGSLISLSRFTGFLVSKESFYTTPGFEASQSGEFVWSPEQQGFLASVRISGYVQGNGTVRVYLHAGDRVFLVLDRPAPTENATQEDAAGEHPAGPGMEDSATAGDAGQESITQEDVTQPGAPASENLTAGNMTLENITAEGNASVTGSLISDGRDENAAGNNSADNSSADNITADADDKAAIGLMYNFADECGSACSLEGVNESSYSLAFEIENGTLLHIDAMRYSIVTYGPEPEDMPPAGQVPDQEIPLGGNATLNLSLYFSDPENQSLAYVLEQRINDSFLDNDTLTIIPNGTGNFTMSILVSDGNSTISSSFGVLAYYPANMTGEAANLTCSSCSDCSQKAVSPAGSIIQLDSDIRAGPGSCVDLSGAHNITLDCRGHTLSGQGSGCGILLSGSTENQIRNCRIEGFYAGVFLSKDSRNNSVLGLNVTGNVHGISLFSSAPNQLEGISGRIRVSSSSRNAISCTDEAPG